MKPQFVDTKVDHQHSDCREMITMTDRTKTTKFDRSLFLIVLEFSVANPSPTNRLSDDGEFIGQNTVSTLRMLVTT